MDETTTQKTAPEVPNQLAVPIAIIIGGALIAGAVYLSNTNRPVTGGEPAPTAKVEIQVPGVQSDDHIIGNPDADIVIVEYSDLDCPFCKDFHGTMKSVMEKYGKDGKVAWVYRNFPLAQLHPDAAKQAEGAECVAEIGGNDTYWKFLDALFVEAPKGTFIDLAKLGDVAASVGVDKAKFQECFDSGRMKARVDKDHADALVAAEGLPGVGTPFNIFLVKGGKPEPVVGAQPFENLKVIIDAILADKAGGTPALN